MTAPATIQPTEQRRIEALTDLSVLDTLPEPMFEAITSAAAQACGVPISLVSLVDTDRQWFKSNLGLPGVAQTPRDVAFCDHTIRGGVLFEVPDARHDQRFADNPLVTGAPHIRFYAGAPIELPGGERVGTVCVIDREPRQLSEAQRATLAGLGRVASVALIDRRRQLATIRDLALAEGHYRAIVEDQTELISLAAGDGTLRFVNAAYARHFGRTVAQMVGRSLLDFVDDADRAAVAAHLRAVAAGQAHATSVNRSQSLDGTVRWVAWTNRPVAAADGSGMAIHSVGRDITEQHLAEARLREALRDKETLLKEVYHRVKNNLQLVQSLLSLQHRSSSDDAARAALAESTRRIRAMALVHEKLYQSGGLDALSLGDHLGELLRQIDEAAGAAARSIRLVAAIEDRRCGLDSAIPVSLLVTELVFNALEHGFDQQAGGQVRVELVSRDGVPCLTVSDNGVGLRPGFDLDNSGSMGLQLAQSLARQLGGQLRARHHAGAEFSAALPLL